MRCITVLGPSQSGKSTLVRQLTALGHTEGEIEEHERELIERAFRLDDTKAWEIMTPRVDVFAWADSRQLGDIASELATVRHSRVPVYGESIDDITGVLYLRDAYQALVTGQHERTLGSLAREPLVVPGSLPGKPNPDGSPAPSLYCAVIVKTVDAQTRAKTAINELLRD